MSVDIKFIPLSFINSTDEILKQIKNTVMFSFLFEQHAETSLESYLESTQYGYTASASELGTHLLVRITDINSGNVNWETVPKCDCNVEDKYLLKDRDILIARTGGTTGKSFIVSNAPSNAIFASYLIRLRLKKGVNIDFINYFLNSYLFWSQIVEMKSGSAMPNVNAEKLKTLKLPKCDFETQNNIVTTLQNSSIDSKYLKLFQKITSVESVFNNGNNISIELNHQLTLLKKIRQQFLQEAVQGILIKNEKLKDKNTETGAALLARIKAEKATAGKKEKPLPPIKKEEIPFEIPDDWVWCRLGEIGDLKRGKSKHRPRNDESLFNGGTFPFIQTGDVSKAKNNKDLITTINGYYNEFGLKQSEMQSKGTLCITIAANIAECGFLDFDACVPDSIVCFNAIDNMIEKYVYYYLKIAKDELERFAPATAQKNINLGILNDLSIPLPPLSIQGQIVEKVNSLMAICDGIEESIRASQKQNEGLLQAVLRAALAG